MKKQAVLLWGNGKALKENIFWIRQLYDVKGITGKSVVETDLSHGLFTIDEALNINYDKIMITSMYHDEIRNELIILWMNLIRKKEFLLGQKTKALLCI